MRQDHGSRLSTAAKLVTVALFGSGATPPVKLATHLASNQTEYGFHWVSGRFIHPTLIFSRFLLLI